ncbi:SLIT and NTRK-like protein 3 [Maylandia zebra]|uniref:SLIT and NTRK-like protein 3 n=1 Tax=Pundamilia nyererei TaxID=303518 RepID=A0A9Y3QUE8_9CICH|nr:PREDICTED: SLIT and NTRK-like protein 3 [Pundamilia nyererei]XP_005723753.1 PREDICTED: SLIT and NTRK-like protein 3 [Pundamilia nyererei]XP_039898221.1 SLIT and NTRK-like protein 3 [Simochromis diagramma]XP_039898222.1 SLIT and NTRK-like protein 3 [Simochromis diagramma]
MQWVTLAVALGCARLSQASHTPTPTPTSTHTPLVDNSEEEVDEPCFEPCTCEVKEGVLHVHCDGRGFTNASQVSQSWVRPFKLNLQRNSLRRLYSNGFQHLGNAVSINLGNNALQDIRVGAFHGLAKLRRLYLHENKLEVFRNDTFAGLEALEYLQADYNVIKRIDSGALRFLYKLRVLILNDNLIPNLPPHLFRSVSLTHLDLRGNRLKSLAYAGTLEYVGRSLMEIQLEENPWNCGCEAVQLQQWLGQIPYTAVVGDVTCEYPFHLHGKDLREIPRKELCADLPDKELQAVGSGPSAGSQPQHLPPNSKHQPGRVRPTKPSSMVHGSRQNTHTSSTSSSSSSAERKDRERHPRPTKRPRPSRTSPTPRSLMPNQNPPVAGYQTRPPIPIICPLGCTCNLHITDLGLTVNCKENGFLNVSQLTPRPLNGRKLYLSGNLIQRIYRTDFWNFSSLDMLHLGNNRISYLQEGAFSSLTSLRSLYLNGNNLERLSPHMFLGLQNLRYLYFEYNEIREVDPGTFDSMPSLQLLFLNANLLRSLPLGVFSRVNLARLNLRNNHLLQLPMEGVLEHLTGLVQVDLQQNPWECNCEAAPLKRWLEGLSAVVVMGEVVCHSPDKTKGVDLRSLSMELLCPELEPQEDQDQEEQTATSTAADRGVSVDYPGSGVGPLPEKNSIPLSVLVLSLLVLFVSAFFAAAALIAYALRRRDKLPFRRQGEVDLAGIQMECGIFTEQTHHHHHHHGLPETPPLPPPEHNHVYDTILPPEAAAKGPNPAAASHMCSNPIYKDEQDAAVKQRPQQQQTFAASKECEEGYCSAAEKEREWALEVSSSPINTVTGAMGPLAGLHGNGILCPTVIDSQGPTPKVELVDCLFRLPTPEFRDLPDRYVRPPPRYPHPQDSKQDTRPDQTLVVTTTTSSTPGGSSQSEQGAGEQRARLRTTPDYMEVLDRSYQF